MEDLGLGYPLLSRLNPRLVFCSNHRLRQTGPWKNRPAYDLALQAGVRLDEHHGRGRAAAPVRVGVAVIDLFTAHYAVQAILSALLEREDSGQGRKIDISMLDCAVASLSYMGQNVLATGVSPQRMGSRHPSIVPTRPFPTQSGFHRDRRRQPADLGTVLPRAGAARAAKDPRFSDNSKRVVNRDALEQILEPLFRRRETIDWLALLQAHDVPATPVNDVATGLALPPLSSGRW